MNRLLLIASSVAVLTACGGGGSGDRGTFGSAPPVATSTFEITVTNLTNAQPLSPLGVVAHDGTFSVFGLGAAASAGLEVLAEGGDNGQFLSDAAVLPGVFNTAGGAAPIGPGGSETLSLTFNEATRTSLSMSVVTMLVNTNDAFTGINGVDLSALAVGEEIAMRSIAYDAGTEADSEGPGTIPGPADGGEGFNAARDDDFDRVSMHAGVVSAQDGLSTSVLTEQHRFDNPVAAITIVRVN